MYRSKWRVELQTPGSLVIFNFKNCHLIFMIRFIVTSRHTAIKVFDFTTKFWHLSLYIWRIFRVFCDHFISFHGPLRKIMFSPQLIDENRVFPQTFVRKSVLQRFFDESRGILYNPLIKITFLLRSFHKMYIVSKFFQVFSQFILEIKPLYLLKYLKLSASNSLKNLEFCICNSNQKISILFFSLFKRDLSW